MSSPLEHLAEHDLLTGVFNRSRMVGELERQISYSARYARAGALVLFDVDHLKAVNDTHGHAAGDALLKAFAECCGPARARATSSLAWAATSSR